MQSVLRIQYVEDKVSKLLNGKQLNRRLQRKHATRSSETPSDITCTERQSAGGDP